MDEKQHDFIATCRAELGGMVNELKKIEPSRELSLSITRIEEAAMWMGKEVYKPLPLSPISELRAELEKEIRRNRELVEEYKKIPTGAFGMVMIAQDINNAIIALAGNDPDHIEQMLEVLKDNK